MFPSCKISPGFCLLALWFGYVNGWALLGLIRTAETAARQGLTEIADGLIQTCRTLLDAMLRFQLPDGRFHDILDDPASFIDGTSAMMTAAGIWRGILAGWLPPAYAERAERAFAAVTERIDAYGLVREVCGCPHFVSPGTSAEAQAAYVMACAWRAKLAGKS